MVANHVYFCIKLLLASKWVASKQAIFQLIAFSLVILKLFVMKKKINQRNSITKLYNLVLDFSILGKLKFLEDISTNFFTS